MTKASQQTKAQEPIAFIDLHAQRRRIEGSVRQAIDAVLTHGQYILGPEVKRLEDRLAAFSDVKHAIGCSSGTDALVLALMALEVKPGDAVFVPSFTFAATAEAVALVGATPVFTDCVEATFNMDSRSLEAAVDAIREENKLRPVGVIGVDMFGQPADYGKIEEVAEKYGLWVMADAAQSYGARYKNRRVGAIGNVATTSFFPAKPLGCYGDGGAIFTSDDRLAELIRSLLFHGKGSDKYDNIRIGMNGRLDTLQAAILLEKMKIFEEEIILREKLAARYCNGLRDVCTVPIVIEGAGSVWAQFTIVVSNRDLVAAKLKSSGIPTAIYYPKPLHRQTAYKGFPTAPGGLPISDSISKRVLSLPMHPYLALHSQDRIIAELRSILQEQLA